MTKGKTLGILAVVTGLAFLSVQCTNEEPTAPPPPPPVTAPTATYVPQVTPTSAPPAPTPSVVYVPVPVPGPTQTVFAVPAPTQTVFVLPPPPISPPPFKVTAEDARRAHEQAAAKALAELESLSASGDYVAVKRLATEYAQTYANTTQGPKFAYLAQRETPQDYEAWIARGDDAAAVGLWEDALAAFRRAATVINTRDVQERIADITRRLETQRQAEAQYAGAMALAARAARAGQWQDALEAYRAAGAVIDTPDARAGIEEARRQVIRDARDRKRLYDATMSDAAAHAAKADWARALDTYEEAFEIDPTPAARAGVARAKDEIAKREAARRRAYADAMADATTATKAREWQRALEAYQRAAAIESTKDAVAGMASVRAKLADEQKQARLYAAAIKEGETSAGAGDWRKALAAYQRAMDISATIEAKAGAALATKKLAETDAAAQKKRDIDRLRSDAAAAGKAGDWEKAAGSLTKALAIDPADEALKREMANARTKLAEAQAAAKEYARLMAEAAAAAKAGDLEKALADYTKAEAVDSTTEVRGAIADVRRKIAAAGAAVAERKREFTRLMTEGAATARAGQWQRSLDAFTKAVAIDPTPEAKAGIELATQKLAENPKAVPTATPGPTPSAGRDPTEKPKTPDEKTGATGGLPASATPTAPGKAPPDKSGATGGLPASAPAAAFDSVTLDVTGGFAGFQRKMIFGGDGKFQVRDAKPARQADGQLTEDERTELAKLVAAVDWKAVKPAYRNPQVADSMDRGVTVVAGGVTHKTVIGDALREQPPAPLTALATFLTELQRRHQK